MLANYDAKGVADLMGIAFLRGPHTRRRTAAAAGKMGKFAFTVADEQIRLVAIGAGDTDSELDGNGGGGDHRHRLTDALICSPSPVLIEKAVEAGLPRLVLRRVAEQLAGADKTKIAALEWVVVPKTTLERHVQQRSPHESERTERVARRFVQARRALGTVAEARAFMTTPHPRLDGRTPMDAARTDLGTGRMEQLLNALEYGLAL
jgi:putative toxin-antitoxin system antitoxin component (TIGR02293 family)